MESGAEVGTTTGPVVATAVGVGAGDSSAVLKTTAARSSVTHSVPGGVLDPPHEAAIGPRRST
ncbi:MAG: hypothetical protein ACKVK3_05770 [Acidimicrobiales bacterium]